MTKEQQRNLYILYTIIGVVVVILLIIWAVHIHRKNEAATAMQGSSQMQTQAQPTATPTPSTTQAGSSTSGNAPAAASTYGAEVAAHPYRIQFSSCHGNPGTLEVAKGDVVMLDNRDSTTHTIKADGQTFTIPGYSWALLHTAVTESSDVTCDGGGAAVLNVQK